MKSKRWILGFFLIVFLGVGLYMSAAYRINPLGFFTTDQGKEYYYSSDSTRALKLKYLYAHRDEYDAVIMGGSKTGQFSVDLLTERSGLRYYNLYGNLGNFNDYLTFTKFLVNKVGIKELTLALSSYEANAYSRTDRGTNYKTPAITTGSKWKMFLEYVSYLVSDRRSLAKYAKKNRSRAEESHYYADCIVDGQRNRRSQTAAFHADPDAYISSRVMVLYQERLAELFGDQVLDESTDDMAKNLEALRQIKQICDEGGVSFRLVITPACFNERHLYETEAFYTYIEEMMQIVGEVWDFSDFNEINMNAYNFLDARHFNCEVADLVVDTIYGVRSYEGFGILLSRDNIADYLSRRRADFETYRKEYLATGTVKLSGMDDPGFLPWREEWNPSAAGQTSMEKYWKDYQPVRQEEETEDPDENS